MVRRHPLVGDRVGLALRWLVGMPGGGWGNVKAFEHQAHGAITVDHHVLLVSDGQPVDRMASEESSPGSILGVELADQMPDGLKAVLQNDLAVGVGPILQPPHPRLECAPQAHRLADLVPPRDPHVDRVAEQRLEQGPVGQPRVFRQPASQGLELGQLVPHELGSEHPVGTRAQAEAALEMLAVVGQALQRGVGRCLGRRRVITNAYARARQAIQVVARVGRPTRVVTGLEKLGGVPGHAGFLEQLA